MTRFTPRHCLRQHSPRLARELRWKIVQRLDLALQLDAEILQLSLQSKGAMLAPRVVYELGLGACCVLPHQLDRDHVPSIAARGTPDRSAKYRSSPVIGPQLPQTLVFDTRASVPSAVRSSITRSNGMNCASSLVNFP